MATTGNFRSISITAGADLNTGDGTGAQYKALAIGGTIAATNALTVGLLQNKPKSGEDAEVTWEGHAKGVAGAAISAGALMMVTTSGYLITRTATTLPCGRALTAAASGATVEGLFNFSCTGVNSA